MRESLLHGDSELQGNMASLAVRDESEGKADGRIGFAADGNDVEQKIAFEERAC